MRLITNDGRKGEPKELPALPKSETVPRQEHARPLAAWRPGCDHGFAGVGKEFKRLNPEQQKAVCVQMAHRERRAFKNVAPKSRVAAPGHQIRAVSAASSSATASDQVLGGRLFAVVSGASSLEQRDDSAAPPKPAPQPGQVGGFTPINLPPQAGPSRAPPPVLPPPMSSPPVLDPSAPVWGNSTSLAPAPPLPEWLEPQVERKEGTGPLELLSQQMNANAALWLARR